MTGTGDIVLYHYGMSVFSHRVIYYLTLRQIPYAQCIQPAIMPRPDLEMLGVKYRRIPILSIGRDIYCDTRLILQKLEERFPASAQHPPIASKEAAAMAGLLSKFTIDGGVFARAAQLIPPEAPVMQDARFLKDRTEFTGRSWSNEDVRRQRPEAIVHMRECFGIVEGLLGDGREWIAGTKDVDLADIDGIWPFRWLMDLKLPAEHFSRDIYPNTYAWIGRFNSAIKAAKATSPKPVTLKGPDAYQAIVSADYFDKQTVVDASDPLRLTRGQRVHVSPIESGFRHKDIGSLVKLTKEEVAVAVKTKDGKGEVRIHAPRWGFRIQAVEDSRL
ncbi:hypothetical protein K431DRAFT_215966 [Polychaeton citri CBS 116435]|uniref:GST N-terminal domain-containing protein n=1 Tax=Polychaeton citri CBS 116435 TaxID=1314669 RepID=A0A9P4QI05_9PEZI|nr:hypothetical protein K431DRAFT_215966 [Polychaeton citri CBS 116435]